jgi:hypothetical protein
MRDKCVELDRNIEHYRDIASKITDQAMLRGIEGTGECQEGGAPSRAATVRLPQLMRGNKYRTVIPAPLVRSRSSVSPSLNSACMASQQEFDQEAPRGMVRLSSPELTRTSRRRWRGPTAPAFVDA